jgi:ferredoxin
VPVGFPCRGEGVCGRCTVEVIAGVENLAPPRERERALLAHIGAGATMRLACFAEVIGGGPIELRVGGGHYVLPGRAP